MIHATGLQRGQLSEALVQALFDAPEAAPHHRERFIAVGDDRGVDLAKVDGADLPQRELAQLRHDLFRFALAALLLLGPRVVDDEQEPAVSELGLHHLLPGNVVRQAQPERRPPTAVTEHDPVAVPADGALLPDDVEELLEPPRVPLVRVPVAPGGGDAIDTRAEPLDQRLSALTV